MTEFNFFQVLLALVKALQWTLILSLIAFAGGGIFGLLLTMMRISDNVILKRIAQFYIAFFQGTPLLMQLFLIFFGIPIVLGFDVSAIIVASIAMTFYASAYLADIWRGSVQAIR
jgi:polar amino acid transport system permease protein